MEQEEHIKEHRSYFRNSADAQTYPFQTEAQVEIETKCDANICKRTSAELARIRVHIVGCHVLEKVHIVVRVKLRHLVAGRRLWALRNVAKRRSKRQGMLGDDITCKHELKMKEFV